MVMKSDDEPAIRAVLRDFFAAMRAWELGCTARHKSAKRGQGSFSDATRVDLDELKSLQRRYCTSWENPERGGSFAIGAEYDPDGERIVEVRITGDEAIVFTEQTTARPANKCAYTLRRGAEGWRLVDNRMRFTPTGELTPWPL